MRLWALFLVFLAPAYVLCIPVKAAEIYHDEDIDARLDNTVRYSVAFRLPPRDAALIADPNADDGDRNFRPGLISNRVDILSEFDASRNGFGVRVSAAAWLDTVYREPNDNDSAATLNLISSRHDEFASDVRSLHGGTVQLSDAFIHGVFDAGGLPISFRIGRHVVLWGESLFFAENGIAAGQAPIDVIKDLGAPDVEAKEVFLPVWQASSVVELRPNVALKLYYQFEGRKDQLPGTGSYFSAEDFIGAGAQAYFFAPGQVLTRAQDLRPRGSGQYGIGLEVSTSAFTYGLYALVFNAKEPQTYLGPDVGTYQLVYPAGIEIYGASFSTSFGESTIAAEISGRRNMPLVSTTLIAPPSLSVVDSEHPLYAIGDTLQGQLSTVTTFAGNALWARAEFKEELAFNERLAITRNLDAFERGRTSFAAEYQASFEPEYFEILPALDLSVPLGFTYAFAGESSSDDAENAGTGSIEIGLSAVYRSVWKSHIGLTYFIGSAAKQSLADRDFVSLSVERTF
ncbi:MAG: DUF1302 family protein [Alphaproteobacteria bacterium]